MTSTFLAILVATRAKLPPLRVPDGLGVQCHIQTENPEELKEISEAGFRWARADTLWHAVEQKKGHYDFSFLDPFVKAADKYHLRLILTLDYGNHLYQRDDRVREDQKELVAPTSVSARAAFVNFSLAVVSRYRGKGILWEVYNEPNGTPYWSPEPDAYAYAVLAQEVSESIKARFPGESVIGPAVADLDIPFMRTALGLGVLKYWDAVSLHAYRRRRPETSIPEYQSVRRMIDRLPGGARTPLICGEWGYSLGTRSDRVGMDEATQANYNLRIYLASLLCGMPVTILYSWYADKTITDPFQVGYGLHDQRGRPRESLSVIRNFVRRLSGYTFVDKMATSSSTAYLLRFRRGNDVRIVGYTIASDPEKEPTSTLVLPPQTKETVRLSKGMSFVITARPTVFDARGNRVSAY